MILYEFKCTSCSLVFEDWTTKEKSSEGLSCPACKSHSGRHYGAMNFSFSGGKPTENNIDMLIGREAEKKWALVNSSLAERQKIRKESNENFLVSPIRGEYRPSTPSEKESNRQIINAYEQRVIQSGG